MFRWWCGVVWWALALALALRVEVREKKIEG